MPGLLGLACHGDIIDAVADVRDGRYGGDGAHSDPAVVRVPISPTTLRHG